MVPLLYYVLPSFSCNFVLNLSAWTCDESSSILVMNYDLCFTFLYLESDHVQLKNVFCCKRLIMIVGLRLVG